LAALAALGPCWQFSRRLGVGGRARTCWARTCWQSSTSPGTSRRCTGDAPDPRIGSIRSFPKRCLVASAAGSTGTAGQADKFVLDFTAFLAKCAPHRRVGFCAHALVVAPRCLRSTSPGVELQCALVSWNSLVFETMDSMRRRSTRVRLASLRGLRTSSHMEDALPASLPAKRADNPASCASVEKENGEVTCCRLPRSRCLRSTCPGVEWQCTLMSRNCLVFDIMDSTRRQSTRFCGIVCDDSWKAQLLTQFMAKTAQAQFALKLLCDNYDKQHFLTFKATCQTQLHLTHLFSID